MPHLMREVLREVNKFGLRDADSIGKAIGYSTVLQLLCEQHATASPP